MLNNGPLAVREAKTLVHDVAGLPLTPDLVEQTLGRGRGAHAHDLD